MTARPVPKRHWRSYGTDPLPTGREALDEPFRAFPSWFMRITCDRCGKDRMLSETHLKRGDMLIRDIIRCMRHDGCGGAIGGIGAANVKRRTSSLLGCHPSGTQAGVNGRIGHLVPYHRTLGTFCVESHLEQKSHQINAGMIVASVSRAAAAVAARPALVK